MKDIFDAATSQFIDIYGKCRILNYGDGDVSLSIIISPIPPLDIKQVTLDEMVITTSVNAIKFINDINDVKIKEQGRFFEDNCYLAVAMQCSK